VPAFRWARTRRVEDAARFVISAGRRRHRPWVADIIDDPGVRYDFYRAAPAPSSDTGEHRRFPRLQDAKSVLAYPTRNCCASRDAPKFVPLDATSCATESRCGTFGPFSARRRELHAGASTRTRHGRVIPARMQGRCVRRVFQYPLALIDGGKTSRCPRRRGSCTSRIKAARPSVGACRSDAALFRRRFPMSSVPAPPAHVEVDASWLHGRFDARLPLRSGTSSRLRREASARMGGLPTPTTERPLRASTSFWTGPWLRGTVSHLLRTRPPVGSVASSTTRRLDDGIAS